MPLFVNNGQDPLASAGLSTAGHEAIDHTGAPFSLLDATAHNAIDHTGLTGIPAAADGETESVTNGPGAGTDITRTIPGGTLAVDNESLEFLIVGSNTGGVADTATLTFGSTTIFPSVGTLSPGDMIEWRGTILRTGASSQLIVVSGGNGGAWATERTVGTEDLSTPLNLTASDAGNQIAFDVIIIRKWAA